MVEFTKLYFKCWQRYRYDGNIEAGRVRHLSAQIYLPKGRTGNGSPTQASIHPLYFVSILIRQPIHQAADEQFPSLKTSCDWGAMAPVTMPLSAGQCNTRAYSLLDTSQSSIVGTHTDDRAISRTEQHLQLWKDRTSREGRQADGVLSSNAPRIKQPVRRSSDCHVPTIQHSPFYPY